MKDEKNLDNPLGSEHYKLGDFLSHKEDKHYALKEGKKQISEVDTHQTHREDKVVILEDSRWWLGRSDKVVHKMVWKEHDLILLLMGYDMSDPQHGVG